jgi:hypothetical protein
MRRATCRSQRAKSRAAAAANSIRQVKRLLHRVQSHCCVAAGADVLQPAFGQIDVLHVGEVFDDGGAGIERFAAAGGLGQGVEPGLDVRWEADG